jgi:hypothetical protein
MDSWCIEVSGLGIQPKNKCIESQSHVPTATMVMVQFAYNALACTVRKFSSPIASGVRGVYHNAAFRASASILCCVEVEAETCASAPTHAPKAAQRVGHADAGCGVDPAI